MPTPPSRGRVSSPYGMRVNPNDGKYRMHYGEDTLGEGNFAPVTGTVVFADYDHTGTGLGYAVGVREAKSPEVIWWVGHHASLSVAAGESVSEGRTKLGVKGESGAAKGVHCHTERRVGGEAHPGSGTPTNPRDYYTTTAGGGVTPFPVDEHEEEIDDMQPKVIGHKAEEVAVLAPWLPNGYLTAKVGSTLAAAWGRLYSPTGDSLVPMYDRDVYLNMIEGAKALAAGYREALPKPSAVGTVAATIDAAAFAPVVAALNNLGVKIDALPAEIDRYADGDKQS